MCATNRGRWERVLLVLAALFGVVAMHAIVAPMYEQAMPAPASAAVSIDEALFAPMAMASAVASLPFAEHEPSAVAASSDMPGNGPMSIPHALMHLCLAILSAGLMLGLLAAAIMVLLRHESTLSLPPSPAAPHPSRPPIRTALRLAQLCVLRN